MASGRAHPVLGFYGPDSMMWRINREAVLLGSGPAALLLQIAHPSVARGVAEHSDFESDPWKRLHGTINTTLAMVFGDGPAAERAVRKLNRVHGGIRGEGYRAMDPELLLWVQSTLIVTSVEAYGRWVRPLAATEKEQFWQEARRVGVRLGIGLDMSPVDWSALRAYWSWMLSPDGPIKVSDVARRLRAVYSPAASSARAGSGDRPADPSQLCPAAAAHPRRVRHTVGRPPRATGRPAGIDRQRLDTRHPDAAALDAPGARRGPTGLDVPPAGLGPSRAGGSLHL